MKCGCVGVFVYQSYLHQGRLHGRVVEATEGGGGAGGREGGDPWKGKKARKASSTGRLEPTAQPGGITDNPFMLASPFFDTTLLVSPVNHSIFFFINLARNQNV